MKKHFRRCWVCLSLLNWIGTFLLSLLLKLPPGKLNLWFFLWNIFLLKLLFIFINLPYSLVSNALIWASCSKFLQIRYYGYAKETRIVATQSFFCRYHLLLNWSNCFHFPGLVVGLLVVLIGCFFSVTIPRCYKGVLVSIFFPCKARPWNSLPSKCFLLSYDWNNFRANKHLLS